MLPALLGTYGTQDSPRSEADLGASRIKNHPRRVPISHCETCRLPADAGLTVGIDLRRSCQASCADLAVNPRRIPRRVLLTEISLESLRCEGCGLGSVLISVLDEDHRSGRPVYDQAARGHSVGSFLLDGVRGPSRAI